jgi:hypothetical protein
MYNSNEAHYMEGESMRAAFEKWFVKYKVDLVFAGHVHAYERSVSSSLQQSFLPFDFFFHMVEILSLVWTVNLFLQS